MTCHTFLCKGLIHQALSLYAIEVPLDVSIVSIRYCSADVDIRPHMKGMYLMRGIAAKLEKGKKKLSVIFIFFCSEWRAMLVHSLVCPTKQALSLYAIGVLYLSALALSVIAMLMFTPNHSSRVFALDVWKRIFHPLFHSSFVISCDALGWCTVSIRYCSVLFAH